MYKTQTQIKCIQINLQHSKLATDNLLKIIEEDSTDTLYPRTKHNSKQNCWLIKKMQIFTSGEGRNRTAIVVTNNQVDTLLIKQILDEDKVVLEVTIDNVKTILASMYFDISRQIEKALLKTKAVILHAMGASVLIAMDRNSKSTSWHNTLTNRRGRILEEFLMIKWLHILNEESDCTTFRSR